MELTYVILLTEDISSVNFSQVQETSADTLRYSINLHQFLVKFSGDTPSFLVGKTEYTHQEILEVLNSPQWTIED